ncbi:SP_0009 family protein [Streptococcus massiliensis]|uniref:Putative extracellular protein n=1 Tax=Streptococcus massiliensis TaxID=313439 RepID=A0A380KYD3_9STRE|nr:SP_0009 family protein [Streptococcus massiliensis]SUN76289.1 putative extracellular protein [Streptococcus massiliensis]
MKNIVETVKKFLAYSDEKSEDLAEKNQSLRTGRPREEKRDTHA